MFKEDFDLLSSQEQERFRKVTNYLLNKTYILSEIYEPRDHIGKINGDYRFIERNFSLFADYLEYCGYRLLKDDAKGVISVNNIYGYNNYKLDKFTTIFLLTLRLIYDEEMQKGSTRNVAFIKVSDVILRMMEEKLLLKKPTLKDTVDTLRTLTKFNIISRLEGAIDDPSVLVVVYPSITKVISNEKINNIYSIMFADQNRPEYGESEENK